MPRRFLAAAALCGLLAFALGCAKGNPDFSQGKKAESLQDYDTALAAYNRALKADPNNPLYRLRAAQMRFEAAQAHVEQGQRIREKGDLQMALAEFRKAQEIDPSNAAAAQEVQNTLALISAKQASEQTSNAAPPAATGDATLMTGPPELKPLSTAPIDLKMVNDSKAVFETIAKLAGVTVIFDPEFTSRRIPFEVNNVTLEQALNIAAMESKAYWKPVTSNIIFVTMDQTQKRHDYEPEDVRTFYLANTLEPNDLTEIMSGLRTLFDLRHIAQINGQNAIIIRDTPDKIALAAKVIDDIDKAKPEIILQIAVLTANRDRTRDLGINPGTTASLTFSPPSTSTSSSSTTTATSIALNELKHLSTADYQVTLPSATANALLTDSTTRIIQNPEIRIVEGQEAKLKIGEKVPVATGSFQAGVGVGTTGGAGIVNPLVNTQFTYLDVGVNVTVTPRVHPDGDVSMKLTIDISAVAGTSSIGGISQPIIAQQDVENEVRLKDGEVNIVGGLIQQTQTNTISGWPGLQKIPLLRYLVADNNSTNNDDELLIVIIPHVVRFPAITAENLQSLYSGTDTIPSVLTVGEAATPPAAPVTPPPASAPSAAAPAAPPAQTQAAQLRFDPTQATMKPGDEKTIAIVADGFQDLFSTPMLLQYDPKIIAIEDVHDGGFLSGGGGTQDYALVQRVDQQHGQAIISATRMPNKPGVSGSGTLLGIQIKALAPGMSKLSIVQVNARDSQQRPIPVVTGEVTVQVQGP